MNNNKISLALLKLLGNIKCTCGDELIIQKVIDSNDQYLLLHAFEKQRSKNKSSIFYKDFHVIYDTKSRKVINPGTFGEKEIKILWPPRIKID